MSTTNHVAYDYNAQKWVDGAAARDELVRQAREELDILRSPRGSEYLRFVGSNRPVGVAIAEAEARLKNIAY